MSVRLDTKSGYFTAVLHIQSLGIKKLNLTQQKQTCTNKPKNMITITRYNKCKKKLKPGLVALYDVWPSNGLEQRIISARGPAWTTKL